jgi:N4-gp56 family major capsid protein
MAVREYAVGDAEAAKIWSKVLMREAIKDTSFEGLWGTSTDSVIQVLDDTENKAGDRISFDLMMQATGRGTGEGHPQEGHEEALVTYVDNIYIGELGHAHKVPNNGTISAQRVPFSPREKCRESLRDWWTTRFDVSMFNQLCGNTAQTDIYYTGLQATVAPTSGKWLFSETGATADADLDSTGDEFTLAMIDKAVATAKTATPRIRPARIKGYPDKLFVCFLHPNQVYQLRQGSLGSTLTWAELQKGVITAGGSSESPVFKGGRAVGIYNGTLLMENPNVTNGAATTTANTNVRRAVFCGAQAAVLAFGKGYGVDSAKWAEELFDYERWFGVRASQIFGIKKTQFNSADFGSIVLSSYSPAL